jgi:ribonuclease G
MRDEMAKDRAKHNILPPSKFGLIQITRQRVRPEMNVVTVEKCPTCGGSGEIQASVLIIDQIENSLRYILKELSQKDVTLCVHPFIEAYITKGLFTSLKRKWRKQLGQKFNVKAMSSYAFLEYHFFNAEQEEIKA